MITVSGVEFDALLLAVVRIIADDDFVYICCSTVFNAPSIVQSHLSKPVEFLPLLFYDVSSVVSSTKMFVYL